MALLGRNGSGKTTLICALMGVARRRAGAIRLGGTPLERLAIEKRAALGLGWVPQERNIFRSLTVEENLTAVARPGYDTTAVRDRVTAALAAALSPATWGATSTSARDWTARPVVRVLELVQAVAGAGVPVPNRPLRVPGATPVQPRP